MTISVSPRMFALANPAGARDFRRALLRWFDRNQRDLPWRKSRDPYHVWLSEIMLQQTRVSAVVEYYKRFLKRFPTVQKLAAARLDSVLTVWSGLGYYRRARFLHDAARHIVRDRNGRFPGTAEEWSELPGIGRYTAAAIASIAFGQPVAVVDGNVERVLSRLNGTHLGREAAWSLAERLLCSERPGDFNQATMELGATICLPRAPRCLLCPVRSFCLTRGALTAPTKQKRQKREIFYALNHRDGAILLKQRPDTSSLMAGMWELPEINRPDRDLIAEITLRHAITVTDYTVHVCKDEHSDELTGRWFAATRIPQLPLTGLARKILRTAGVI